MYRLHIDVPLDMTQEDAIETAKSLMDVLDFAAQVYSTNNANALESMNHRLGNDDDRQKSNYLLINENGHVSQSKIKKLFA